MTPILQASVQRRLHTVSPLSAAHGMEVVTMVDVTRSGAAAEQVPIVFVVDDDVSVRESLELLIASAGWRPETFASAKDFLSRPRAGVPCCVVLDVKIPGLNGLELQQRLGDRSDMPI